MKYVFKLGQWPITITYYICLIQIVLFIGYDIHKTFPFSFAQKGSFFDESYLTPVDLTPLKYNEISLTPTLNQIKHFNEILQLLNSF